MFVPKLVREVRYASFFAYFRSITSCLSYEKHRDNAQLRNYKLI